MARVDPDQERSTLTECRYVCPEETLIDLQRVRARFPDLRLYVDFYCFPNKEKKRLLYLAGTLPVHYDGSPYNIPVCIWLHETHPVSRPRCYVCPSVSMVMNPSCPCVDAAGKISLTGLNNWTQGVSNLSLLVSEMRQAFRENTPLYTRCSEQAPPLSDGHSSSVALPSSSCGSVQQAAQWDQSRAMREKKSYTEELMGIDFSAPPSSSPHSNPFLSPAPSDVAPPLSSGMGALRLDAPCDSAPVTRHTQVRLPQMAAHLPADRAANFIALMEMEGRGFRPCDILEAVELNRDLPSALRFLTHCCPLCQDQVTFSKIITMTHCSCFLCHTCFKAFFSAAIKERSIDQLVCPQCGKPEVKGQGAMEESMEYFNLLDTQIRHFLSPQVHELFQRKLRDRALQEMKNFCWCSHCSFGILHEAERLRMDCPNCKKSTCSQCRSPWSPQHQGRSCDEFKLWQQQNEPDNVTQLGYNSIECPVCESVFSLCRGGCLHFTCSQCRHQFCGGCRQNFRQGTACGFSVDCGTKGLHAHHPRDCLYHLRDWSVTRLHLLLQSYRISPSCLEPANESPADCARPGVCSVLLLMDDGFGASNKGEEPCGRVAEYRGYCQLHYKERLVELINRCRADPVVVYTAAEMKAELQRWYVAVPTRQPEESEPLYEHRLRLTVTHQVPLRKQRQTLQRDLRPLTSAATREAPPSLLQLTTH